MQAAMYRLLDGGLRDLSGPGKPRQYEDQLSVVI